MKKQLIFYGLTALVTTTILADHDYDHHHHWRRHHHHDDQSQNDTYRKRQSRRDRNRDRQGGGVGVQLGGVAFGLGDGVFLVGRAPDNDLPLMLPVYPGDND
ncbi:MAG TPA: hypothetical protein VJJ83_00835 [Candidatus Babeliales bacterium]|nr:hypothetical protein [Candidatus Babeliales bacterium]